MFTRATADAVLLGGVAVLLACNVISVDQALAGFANEGVATVGILRVVAHALSSAGAVPWYLQRWMDRGELLMGEFAQGILNARVVGSVFVGGILQRKSARQRAAVLRQNEIQRARQLGRLLALPRLPPLATSAMRVRGTVEPLGASVAALLGLK